MHKDFQMARQISSTVGKEGQRKKLLICLLLFKGCKLFLLAATPVLMKMLQKEQKVMIDVTFLFCNVGFFQTLVLVLVFSVFMYEKLYFNIVFSCNVLRAVTLCC